MSCLEEEETHKQESKILWDEDEWKETVTSEPPQRWCTGCSYGRLG